MDEAHKETDRLISSLEKDIRATYNRASKDVEAKFDKYLASFKRKDEAKRAMLKAGEITQKEYNYWRTGQIMIGKRWEEMRDTLATDLLNTDKIARSMSKGYMEDAYALNHNYATFEVEKQSLVDTSYTLYDRNTVERLIRDNPDLLPPPTPSGKTARDLRDGKILRWNKQKITAEVTQSILQGESIDKMARRLRNVTDMDKRASIRNARTAMTGAQNAGRQAGYERAKGMGIDTEKQWLAVMDGRTRHEHRILDGQHVPVDKKFKVSNYELEFPADPKADPEMVYNCRCTMICRLKGFEDDFTDRRNPELGDMTYDEWKGIHKGEQPLPELKLDKLKGAMKEDDFNAFHDLLDKAENRKLYELYGDECRRIEYKSGAGCYRASDSVEFGYVNADGRNKYSTLAHEMGHMFDAHIGRLGNLTFNEVDTINKNYTAGALVRKPLKEYPSMSDKFLSALRKDMENIKNNTDLLDEYSENRIELFWNNGKSRGATVGVQDALDGFYAARDSGLVWWGHGSKYYNRKYNNDFKNRNKEGILKQSYLELGLDASNQDKVKKLTRQYEAASEAWANVSSAVTVRGDELEAIEKYMPETLKAYREILEGL